VRAEPKRKTPKGEITEDARTEGAMVVWVTLTSGRAGGRIKNPVYPVLSFEDSISYSDGL
jgi:hypothetical protein